MSSLSWAIRSLGRCPIPPGSAPSVWAKGMTPMAGPRL